MQDAGEVVQWAALLLWAVVVLWGGCWAATFGAALLLWGVRAWGARAEGASAHKGAQQATRVWNDLVAVASRANRWAPAQPAESSTAQVLLRHPYAGWPSPAAARGHAASARRQTLRTRPAT